MRFILIFMLSLLYGCTIEDVCNEYYISEWNSVTSEDGSMTTAEPVYKCRR